ncbi:MAG: hypothetical protein ACXVJ8_16560 [Candidatus Angelobacter sp.]
MHVLLTPYLDATEQSAEDARLQELRETHAFPLIRRVVAGCFPVYVGDCDQCVQPLFPAP